MRPRRVKKEGEIVDAISRHNEGLIDCMVENFVVERNMFGKWEVGFTWNETKGYRLCKKHGEIREFPRMHGIQEWMEKVGVKEFSVKL